MSAACLKCGAPGARDVTHLCTTAGAYNHPPAAQWVHPEAELAETARKLTTRELCDELLDEPSHSRSTAFTAALGRELAKRVASGVAGAGESR